MEDYTDYEKAEEDHWTQQDEEIKELKSKLNASEARVKELETVIDERKCQPCINVKQRL